MSRGIGREEGTGRGRAGPREGAVIFGSLALATLLLRFRFSFAVPPLRATVETILTMCALTSGWWLALKFKRRRRLSNLLSLVALVALGFEEFIFFALPAMVGSQGPLFGTAALHATRLIVAAMFAAASIAPRRRVSRTAATVVLGTVLICAAAISAAAIVLGGDSFGIWRPPQPSGRASIALTLPAVSLLLLAGLGYSRSAIREQQGMTAAMLAGASILLAAGWSYDLLVPSPTAGAISGRECLRAMAYGLILTIASKTRRQVRHAETADAESRERRRIIRDLHDGMAQDLAFIIAHADSLAHDLGHEHPVAIAARRTLATSRGVIADLSASDATTAARALQTVAAELSSRHGVPVVVDADGADLPADEREHVVRIAREAIVNAIVHGRASHITASLHTHRQTLVLRISDDGSGLDSAALKEFRRGYGLREMRERTEAIGGRLILRERPEGGTTVEVLVS